MTDSTAMHQSGHWPEVTCPVSWAIKELVIIKKAQVLMKDSGDKEILGWYITMKSYRQIWQKNNPKVGSEWLMEVVHSSPWSIECMVHFNGLSRTTWAVLETPGVRVTLWPYVRLND